MHVTQHNVGARLSKLTSAIPKAPKSPVAPKAPVPKAPPSAKAPAAPQRNGSKLPPKMVPKARPSLQRSNVNRIDETSILSGVQGHAADFDDEVDLTPSESKSRNQSINKVDITKIDPGPEVEDVPCGFNCGSCSHFLKLNDPRRDDPQFMEDYLRLSSSCPVAILELVKLKGRDINDVVARANTTACTKFKLNMNRTSPDFRRVLESVRSLDKGEFDILVANMDKISREKAMEGRYGCKIGELIRTKVSGIDGTVQAKVTGFSGKSIVARVIHQGRAYTVKLPIIEAKLVEDESAE